MLAPATGTNPPTPPPPRASAWDTPGLILENFWDTSAPTGAGISAKHLLHLLIIHQGVDWTIACVGIQRMDVKRL